MIERGELRLPEMQRRYVWRAPRVRDLLDSLYRGYPSGSILVWETDEAQPTQEAAVPQAANPFAAHKLLLDGQQRLTSLSAILRGEPVTVRGRKRPIEILFNLEHPDGFGEFTEVEGDEDSPVADDDELEDPSDLEDDEAASLQQRFEKFTFIVSSKALANQPNWISVTKVFKSDSDSEFLKHAGVTGFDDLRYAKYTARLQKLRRIRDYAYVMHVLDRDLSYQEVAEIFVRVNSLGVKLRGSDLALAQITARWRNSLKLLEDFQDECEDNWFTLDLGLLVRAMVVFATGQSRFLSVANIPLAKLEPGWEQAKAGLRYAINFLRSNARIDDESLLSSPMFIVAIAYLSQLRGGALAPQEERDLLYWLYIANARGRFSRGSTETLLDSDLATMRKGTAADLIELVHQQFGRLDMDVADFVGRGSQSPLFSLVYLALKAQGARDWKSGLEISLTHQGRLHYIQYHHIFPKAKLKGRYQPSEIHDIANMAFISGQTNQRFGSKVPADYLPAVIAERGENALASQCVPLDTALWQIENYKEFLDARRRRLVEVVNEFIGAARSDR